MNDRSMRTLRRLVWLYFWLLIFEGALRKWLVPQLSNALLIVRDPVVILIYLLAIRDGVFPRSTFIWSTAILAVLSFAASFAGDGTLAISLYGLRSNFLHLPLIVLLPRILWPEDIRRIGTALLAFLPCMMILAILQFKGGPDSRWNVGAGGEAGAQLAAAAGKVRASGTFSFVTGLATYLALCAAYLLAALITRRTYSRWLLLLALPALVFTLVISASRTAVLSVAIVCLVMLAMGLSRPAAFGAAVRPIVLTLATIAALAWLTPIFAEGIAVHRERFAAGGGLEEGILYRVADDFGAGWRALFRAPPLGLGLGLGTSVGARLLSGHKEFLLGEGEWERVIAESGPFLGSGYLLLRLAAFGLVFRAALAGFRRGRALPMLLLSATGLDLINGQFGQPTALGFAVFIAGLAIAASEETPGIAEVSTSPPCAPLPERIRGRSRYAERIHGEQQASGKS